MFQPLDSLLAFISILNEFRCIERGLYANGEDRNENDVEHSYFLAMIGWYIIDAQSLSLDARKVVSYALVHDLVEVYSGDVYFYGVTPEDLVKKKQREHEARVRLQKTIAEFPSLHTVISEYERQEDPESKFVNALDKLQPALNIYLDKGRSWKRDGITHAMLVEKKADKAHISPELQPIFEAFLKFVAGEQQDLFASADTHHDVHHTSQQRQDAKEHAVLLALNKDMALIRRELEIWGMKKDGSTVFISKSDDYDQLWSDALTALKQSSPLQ